MRRDITIKEPLRNSEDTSAENDTVNFLWAFLPWVGLHDTRSDEFTSVIFR